MVLPSGVMRTERINLHVEPGTTKQLEAAAKSLNDGGRVFPKATKTTVAREAIRRYLAEINAPRGVK